ncbi:D-specific alpha-keto acid dehydrogenase [Paenibacillus sp. UNCCL117]|uniref:D-lactate dehydrogenase VanH n=1 Tax=unclassified Paenibacillus TaxID=185978 RepID=UPI00087EAD32|nr:MULTISPECIES: D-lactate dehydrogenase VanH [unclassified Paenibacillus]SDC55226.1 D-specific alpha-keto acid dehydrogenase [Paenibacillus sp. cl123]SFW10951.1 D-specific alpha-keto acid dehydrogenase [Paenibacillus sp. UNCCL117]
MTKSIGITVYGCEQDEAEAFRALSPRFGIMPTIINAAVSEVNALSALGHSCISVGHKSKVSASVLLALKKAGVKYISTRSVGCNHIDTTAAKSMGISVGNVAYSPDSVADFTIMLMLMALRNAKSIERSVEKHDFRLSNVRGKVLRDMTVGVLGTGHIGKAVMERLRAFGCRVLAYSRTPSIEANYVPLDVLLQNSDIVTLHVPLSSDTRHIISHEQISRMKQGALIINTGRGMLVDTAALVQALEAGKLGGAALDVLEGEEGIFYLDCRQQPIDHPFLLKLQGMSNVILTPHMAYYTEQALRDTVIKTIKNCLDFERSLAYG